MWLRVLSLFSLILIGCEQNINYETEIFEAPDIKSVIVDTDKDSYTSHELMEISVDIVSANIAEGLQLALYGIEIGGKPRMYGVLPVNLTKGSNLIRYGYKLPACNSCSGLKPGIYKIHAELYYMNEIVNESVKEVELK